MSGEKWANTASFVCGSPLSFTLLLENQVALPKSVHIPSNLLRFGRHTKDFTSMVRFECHQFRHRNESRLSRSLPNQFFESILIDIHLHIYRFRRMFTF